MRILDVQIYRDGGSKEVITDDGTFIIDGAGFSNTRGRVFTDWPRKGGVLVSKEVEFMIQQLTQAFEDGERHLIDNHWKPVRTVSYFLKNHGLEQLALEYEEYAKSTNYY